MKDKTNFFINDKHVQALGFETIWEVAKREGYFIPHLCHNNETGYEPDGNCRACVIEVEGERVLSASCIRKPEDGMKVITNNKKVEKSQKLILELLLSDQPEKEKSHNKLSPFWKMINSRKITESRFPKKDFKTVLFLIFC